MLSSPRATQLRTGMSRTIAVKAGAMIHQGGIVVADGGYARAGIIAAGLISLGMATETVDNTTGVDGDRNVNIDQGCFLYANSAGDPVSAASLNQPVFIEDDQTVSATDGGGAQSSAGTCFDVDGSGVWVTSPNPNQTGNPAQRKST